MLAFDTGLADFGSLLQNKKFKKAVDLFLGLIWDQISECLSLAVSVFEQ